jgi:pyruvate,orthophosphate dikinase
MTAGPRGAALVRDVVQRANDPIDPLSSIGALELVTPEDLELVLHPTGPGSGAPVLASGIGASPGVGVGIAVFDAGRALDRAGRDEPFVLVRPVTEPADEPALALAVGVVTSGGGLASHAAVLARGRGLPAVVGAGSLVIGDDGFTAADGTVVREGDVITIDGSRGEVSVGDAAGSPTVELPEELEELLAWADEVRAGSLAILANADTAADARRALGFGAEGVGLCRVEHLLLATGGFAALRRAVGTAFGPPDAARDGSDAVDDVQARLREGFEELLEVMDGRPVTVRLLDVPLHELGRVEASAGRWPEEHNPMLGLRGVRLAVVVPALYRAQVRALAEAVAARLHAGGRPDARVLVPFVSLASELAFARELVESTVADTPRVDRLPTGVMVETPRAALCGAELVSLADFVSFGTNDLTQLVLGISRDDAGSLLDRYLGSGLLGTDPFRTLDGAVGQLVSTAVEQARAEDPSIEIGVCGEHGGDPASIAFFRSVGIDHVSCSPFRVPVARLAAARAVLGVEP